MKTYMSMPSGYCDGVTRAIMLANSFKRTHKDKEVYVLGTLVHNEIVTMELEKIGIHSLNNKLSNEEKIKSLPNNCCLIFSAHGHDKKLEKMCLDKNIEFLDATCPIVEMANNNVRNALKNHHQVIYIGKKEHPETIAILSNGKEIYLYEDIKDKLKVVIKDDTPYVINQTTLSIYEIDDIFKKIKETFPNAIFQNEICNATRLRQEAIKKIPDDVDCVFIVGGKDSSNSKRLYEIAKSYFTTLKIFYILNEDQVDKKALVNCRSAAIISGASTPINETLKIKVKLMDI